MMRILAVVVALTACFPDSTELSRDPIRPDAGGGGGGGGGGNQTEFDFKSASVFGVGMTFEVAYVTNSTNAVIDLEVQDPTIATATFAPNLRVALTGKKAGTTKVLARLHSTNAILDQLELTVMDVGAIELRFRTAPTVNGPVTALAALPLTKDSFGVVYRSTLGDTLAGHGTYNVNGAVAFATNVPERLSDQFYGPKERISVEFGASGTGTIEIELADMRKLVVPVEIVAAPATFQLVQMVIGPQGGLVPMPSPVNVGELIGSDLIARTSDGRFVAGATTKWSGSGFSFGPLGDVTVPATEIVFTVSAPGSFTLSTTAGVTQQIIAQ